MTKPVLLLDLGGVLADLGDPVHSMRLNMTDEEFWHIWLNSETVRAFETGNLTQTEFENAMGSELGVADNFAVRFAAWQLTLFPGVAEFLRNKLHTHRLALLSNTNPLHWRQVTKKTDIFNFFEKLFLSYENGQYKPDVGAFLQVQDYFGVASQISFYDDSPVNIATAQELGFDAHLVTGTILDHATH